MAIKIGINGFGRIGRSILRALVQRNFPLEVSLINELADIKTNAHLLRYDSVHGRLGEDVEVGEGALVVGGREIRMTALKNPEEIPWGKMGIDIVLECTGLFTSREKASLHIKGGAKKVIISAPADGPDITVCCGINLDRYQPEAHHLISNASCTTNCLAPIAKVLNENFGIEQGLMTTIHSYTNDQRILDVAHKDLRRARGAALSQIPTKTGAAEAVGLVLPELKGKIDGMAIRVPTANVSCVDFVCQLNKTVTAEEINNALKTASVKGLKGILGFTAEPLVSADFNGDPRSAIVDAQVTKVIGGHLAKVLAWYDNETGFSHRMVDVAEYVSSH